MFEDFLPGARNLVDALKTPEGKRALVAFGINLMQPIPFGQSPIGQIGQSIGAGFDTYDAAKKAQAAADQAALNQEQENRKIDISQQNADTAASNKGLSFSQLFNVQRSNEKEHRAYLRKQAEDEAKRDAPINPQEKGPTADEYLADPSRVQRYEQNWQRYKTLGTDGSQPPAPTAPATPSEATPTPAPSGEGVPMSQDRTFKSWAATHPDDWNSARVALYSNDPQMKAKAVEYFQKLRGMLVDPQELDRQLSRDHG